MLKDDQAYIDHLLFCIQKIKSFSKDLTEDEFYKDEMVQDAVIINIEVIGEVSNNVSKEFKRLNKVVPWREMAGMRDKLIHDYLGVDIQVVWKTVQEDIPFLENLINNLSK